MSTPTTRQRTGADENGERCSMCGTPYAERTALIGGTRFAYKVAACSCWKDAERRAKEERFAQKAEIRLAKLREQVGSRAFDEFSFAKFVEDEKNRAMLEAARSLRYNELPNCLVLAGPPGCGKTMLAVSAAKAEIERAGALTRFARASELVTRLRGAAPSEKLFIVERLNGADILILDDLGPVREPTMLDDILTIVDHRYRHGKCLIVTTNIPVEALNEAVGMKLASRICDKTWSRTASYNA